MEPRIQYAKTSDGVSIAFFVMGQGTPALVALPRMPWSHIQGEWQISEVSRAEASLAQKRMLVRYDGRGNGLSERDVSDYSLDALLLDLEAVTDRIGQERFALSGFGFAGIVAIAYTARHPERVSHLVLWSSFARGSDFWRGSKTQAVTALREKDWDLFTEVMGQLMVGWSGGELARRVTAMLREGATPEGVQRFMAAARQFDVTPLLPQLKCPTLVCHPHESPITPIELSRELAARTPGARLAILEGEGEILGGLADAINDFLGESEKAEVEAQPAEPGGFRTVLFTDIVGHTAMMSRLGDERGRDILREHERITREALKAHGGTEVKTMGDGFMASFASVTRGVECAIALQRAFAERNQPAAEPLHIRVGLNAGEPIEEQGDLFGATVILAARIAASADGAEILASDVVRQLCAGKGFLFADRGEHVLRGFEDPVRIFEISWRDQGL